MKRLIPSAVVALVCIFSVNVQAKDVQVCIEVDIRSHGQEKAAPKIKEPAKEETSEDGETKKKSVEDILKEIRASKRRSRIYPFPPKNYLKRMLEHYVTHEHGFVAVKTGCQQRLRVELYPLGRGWTIFGRYSGFHQEEKVDRIFYAEFPRVAKRLVTALLYNKRVDDTIDRLSVLKADSIQDIETIKGTHHFVAAVGSAFRFALPGLNTAIEPDDPVEKRFRLLTPVDLQFGYRASFRKWCLDAFTRLSFGVGKKAQRNNTLGGHVDHTTDLAMGLNFFWYSDPSGFNSFYSGAGASFDLSWYNVVEPTDGSSSKNYSGAENTLFGAGLTANIVLGYEFMRTSRVRPFAQLEFNLPAYLFDTENNTGEIEAWIPGVTVMAGVMF
jgi:hypothetical protein